MLILAAKAGSSSQDCSRALERPLAPMSASPCSKRIKHVKAGASLPPPDRGCWCCSITATSLNDARPLGCLPVSQQR